MKIKNRSKRHVRFKLDLINERIKFPQLMLLTEDKKNLGIMSTSEALKIAKNKELDLYCVSEQANPPVCMIGDYYKYKYSKKKKEKIIHKSLNNNKVRQIRINANIDKNDLNVKAKKAIEFLKAGQKVTISLALWGRQLQNINEFLLSLNEMVNLLSEYGKKSEDKIKRRGNFFEVLIVPKKSN